MFYFRETRTNADIEDFYRKYGVENTWQYNNNCGVCGSLFLFLWDVKGNIDVSAIIWYIVYERYIIIWMIN